MSEPLPPGDYADIRADHKKLNLEVVKMYVAGVKTKWIAGHFGIALEDAEAIVRAFKRFLSTKAF